MGNNPTSIVSSRGNHIQGDFEIIHTLLKKFSLYKIPDYSRAQVIQSATDVLEDEEATPACRMTAAKLLLEADKRNIDLIKLAMPKHVVHHNVKEMTDEELMAAFEDVRQDPKIQNLLDQEQEIIDVDQPANSKDS